MNFSDKIIERCDTTKSVVVAGFDPRPESFPAIFLTDAHNSSENSETKIFNVLRDFHLTALESLADKVAAIKPNAAFFEQFGIGGIRALHQICLKAKSLDVPVIMDAKRGDIGSTAEAYSRAFLGQTDIFGESFSAFPSAALTVNPFLGFDTLEPFIADAKKFSKGIFILVKTSNPGSADVQGQSDQNGAAKKIADWIAANSERLQGDAGYSSLGAVVGATYPAEARLLRELMPKSLFLVPGYGAQGGTAKDVLPNFDKHGKGALINVSRGLLGSFSSSANSYAAFKEEITKRILAINHDINSALKEA
jgi:orotidine-5'-phosphate decarboxylase